MSQIAMSENLPGVNLFRIDGQLAVITGASRGLGWAMACGLASAGANLLLVSRSQDQLDERVEQIA
ncbi:MAG: SDR family NAD(P)-dependent oxidoreductase, partial [Pirellula sp.]